MTNLTTTAETTTDTETPVHTGRPVKVWGVKITPASGVEVKVGDTVGVRTKHGKQWTATIVAVIARHAKGTVDVVAESPDPYDD